METAGLAIAIPGLLIIVSKSYSEINRAVEDYRKIDKNLFDTLNRLAAETNRSEFLIKSVHHNENKETRGSRGLDTNSRGHSDGHAREEAVTCAEDKNLSQAIVGYIQYIHTIMEEMSTILRELGHPSSKPNPIDTKANPWSSPITLALQTVAICLNHKASVTPTTQRSSRRRKLKLVFSKTRQQLVSLLEDLRNQNDSLTLCLFSDHHFNVQTTQEDQLITSTEPITIEPDKLVAAVIPSPEAEQDQQQYGQHQPPLPTMLYQILAQKLQCQCHLLHLGLETQHKIQVPGIIRSEGPQRIEFSVFVTSSMCNQLSRTTCDLYLEIVNILANDIRPLSCCIADNLCEALFVQQQDKMEYLLEDFLVRRVPQFKGTQSGNALSLHDLADGKRRLTQYDRLKLAVKLGRAAVSLHSSPWISGWDSQKIVFFAQYEESREPADWRPHISTILDPNYTPRPLNADIYALGMILLEFGGVDMDEYRIRAPMSSNTLAPALTTVMKELGLPYMKVAECCFNVYKDSMSINQSQQRNMDVLYAEIENLERHVTECFEF